MFVWLFLLPFFLCVTGAADGLVICTSKSAYSTQPRKTVQLLGLALGLKRFYEYKMCSFIYPVSVSSRSQKIDEKSEDSCEAVSILDYQRNQYCDLDCRFCSS